MVLHLTLAAVVAGAPVSEALLVLAGANVTATNVTFQNDKAQGGNGGGISIDYYRGGGGGGGYLTDGTIGKAG